MSKNVLRECLGCVAVVAKAWADDPLLGASLRHMSSHVYRLATEAAGRKELCASSVKNVEVRFCLMCQRLKAGQGECAHTLEQCQLLKGAGSPAVCSRVVNLGLAAPLSLNADDRRVLSCSG